MPSPGPATTTRTHTEASAAIARATGEPRTYPFAAADAINVHVDRNLALEVVRVTEAAALAAARFVGRGDREGADRAATEAMRKTFGFVQYLRGRVVIGEGERDEAPMLYIGEPVGDGASDAPEVDIAVDPPGGDEPGRGWIDRRAGGGRDGRAGPVPQRPGHLHGQDRGGPRGARRHRHPPERHAQPGGDRRGEEGRGWRPDRRDPRAPPPRGAHRRGARDRRADPPHLRRRRRRGPWPPPSRRPGVDVLLGIGGAPGVGSRRVRPALYGGEMQGH